MTKPKTTERLIAYQKAKIDRIDARIKDLQAQRDVEETTLAELRTKNGRPEDPSRICNPVVTTGGQPFRGTQQVILEKRDPQTGKLDFTGEQPPTGDMTFDGVWALYTRTNPKEWSGSWETLLAWLNSKGWVVRIKTW